VRQINSVKLDHKQGMLPQFIYHIYIYRLELDFLLRRHSKPKVCLYAIYYYVIVSKNIIDLYFIYLNDSINSVAIEFGFKPFNCSTVYIK